MKILRQAWRVVTAPLRPGFRFDEDVDPFSQRMDQIEQEATKGIIALQQRRSSDPVSGRIMGRRPGQ